MSEGYSSKPMQATKIGDRIVRVDAVQKARGEAVYVCDMTLPDMQYAYMVRSTIARGRIKAIHVPELPEGYYFISAKDIPAQGKNELWMIAKDWRCFAEDYVLNVGETIGLVVGPDRSVLKRIKAQIKIDYEEQTPAVTIDDGIHCVGGPMVPEKNSHVMPGLHPQVHRGAVRHSLRRYHRPPVHDRRRVRRQGAFPRRALRRSAGGGEQDPQAHQDGL